MQPSALGLLTPSGAVSIVNGPGFSGSVSDDGQVEWQMLFIYPYKFISIYLYIFNMLVYYACVYIGV